MFSYPVQVNAQRFIDSLEYSIKKENLRSLNSKYDKQLNTHYLNTILFINQNINKFNFVVSENYGSTFIRSRDKSIRDEHFFTLTGIYSINSLISIGSSVRNNILSDNRKIEINQASISNAVLLVRSNPLEEVFLTSFGGYSNNRQIGENDYGFYYGIEGKVDQLELSEVLLSSEIKFQNEDVSPRKNATRYFNLSAANYIDYNISNHISAKFIQNKKDFYYQADSVTSRSFNIVNNIQSRQESIYSLQDQLKYNNFLNFLSLQVLGRASLRTIERDTRYRTLLNASASLFDTKINELRLDFESILFYSSRNFNATLKFLYAEKDEKHFTKSFEGINPIFFEERSRMESRKNNNSIRGAVSLSGEVNISNIDRLSFSLFQNKLKYDTPSNDNYDDRDELLSIVRIKYSRKLNPFFEAFINAEGTQSHTVYIFSEKSSNNNVNRIIKLAAGGNYSGKNISSFNSFDVSANYTVYDFEDLNPNYRSFSFRQFTAIDSSNIRIFRNVSFNVYSYVKLSEQGDFNWAAFTARPTRYLEEIYAEPKLILDHNGFLFSAGLRYFSLRTFNFNGLNKVIDSEYLSLGPLAGINFNMNGRLLFRLNGWYEFITITGSGKKEQVNFSLDMKWDF
jgi:hypothetical protein